MNEVSTLIQLAIGLLVFATLIAYLLVKIPKRYRFKFLLIPATFALALYMGLTIPQLLGYAFPSQPQGTFTYVSHSVSKNGDQVTLVTKNGSGKYRMFQFEGTPEIIQELAQARALTQKGQTVEGSFKGKIDKFGFPGLFQNPSPLEIHSPHNYGMLPPKDPVVQQPQPPPPIE